MAANDSAAAAAIPHRVGVLERRADSHADELDGLQRGKADRVELEKLADQLNSLRKVLIGLMVTIAGSAIVFALSVLQFVLTTGSL